MNRNTLELECQQYHRDKIEITLFSDGETVITMGDTTVELSVRDTKALIKFMNEGCDE